jgi:hypothetical protein
MNLSGKGAGPKPCACRLNQIAALVLFLPRLPLEQTMRPAKDHEITLRNLSRALLSARGIENASGRSLNDGRAVTIIEFPSGNGPA